MADDRAIGTPQGRCDTTMTERFSYPDCSCGTYEGNLGPCKTWLAGPDPLNPRCTYCDHALGCHLAIGADLGGVKGDLGRYGVAVVKFGADGSSEAIPATEFFKTPEDEALETVRELERHQSHLLECLGKANVRAEAQDDRIEELEKRAEAEEAPVVYGMDLGPERPKKVTTCGYCGQWASASEAIEHSDGCPSTQDRSPGTAGDGAGERPDFCPLVTCGISEGSYENHGCPTLACPMRHRSSGSKPEDRRADSLERSATDQGHEAADYLASLQPGRTSVAPEDNGSRDSKPLK